MLAPVFSQVENFPVASNFITYPCDISFIYIEPTMSHTSGKILLKLVVKLLYMSMRISLLQKSFSEKSKIHLNFCFVLDEVKTVIIPILDHIFLYHVFVLFYLYLIKELLFLLASFHMWNLKFPYHLEFIFL